MSDERRPANFSNLDEQIEALIRSLIDAQNALQAALPEHVNVVIDPASGTPILLLRAQQALQASEDRYRHLISRLSAIVFELTADGTTLFVNEAIVNVTGYRPQDLLGRNWWDVLCPDGVGELQTELLTGDVTGYELLLTTKSGSKITLEFNSANRYRADGALDRIVGLGFDISERKIHQEALRHDEERLQAMLRYSSDNVSILDESGNVRFISPAIERILGYTPQELAGNSIIKFIHPDDADEANHVIARIMAQPGEMVTMEVRALHKNGTWRILEVSATNLFDDPAVRGIVTNAHDITERRQAEKTRLSLATIVEASGDTIVSEVINGVITSWNSGAENVYGYTAEEAIGKSPSFVMPTGFPDETQMFLERIKNGELIRQHETIRQRKDGTQIYVSLTVLPIKDATGDVIGVAGVGREVTRQKKSQDDLHMLAQVVESSDDAIILKSVDGTILSWNKGAERIYSYSKDEIIGKSIAVLTPSDRLNEFPDMVNRLRQGEQVQHYETLRQRKDGLLMNISLSIALIKDSAGKIIGVSGIERDVTARKQADEKIYFQARLLDSAGQAIIASDLQGNVIYWNRFAETLYQWPHTENDNHNLFELVPNPEITQISATLKSDIAKGERWTNEFNARRADGFIFPVLTTNSLIYNDAGTLIGIVGVSSDISERKRTEEMLKQQAVRLENQHRIDDAILNAHSLEEITQTVLHQVVNILDCKGGTISLFDFEARELIFVNSAANEGSFSAANEGSFSQGVRVSFDDIRTLQADFEVLRRGEMLIIDDITSFSASPTQQTAMAEGRRALLSVPLLNHGILIGALNLWDTRAGYFNNQDLTFVREAANSLAVAIVQMQLTDENARLYQETQKLNTELEQRVRNRTAELELANKELEAFSYSISHDLRSPLRAIDGFSRIVLRDYASQLPSDGQRRLQVIRNNAQHMGELIDDLLNFSRLSRQPLHRYPVAPGDLIKHVLTDLASEMENRTIELKVDELPAFYADPALMTQVFINLISNALKYTRTRTIARIEIGNMRTDGESVYYIKDNGVGFDMIYADKLFGVFQRLHDAEAFEGTGVGLAIVQRIIHRHGGRVWVEAEVGRGATFYFTLEGEASDVRK